MISQRKHKTIMGALLLLFTFWSPIVLGQCLTAEGPYENHLGWTIFPFTNSCSQDAAVSLCVKSWPPGSSEPAYNSYGGVVPAGGRLEITDGMWRSYDSYRWQEDAPQPCPFE